MARKPRIRRDDTVRVLSGKDRGKSGRVLRVEPRRQRVFVEGLNIQKRHQRPRTLRDVQRAQELGGIVESEGPIHISNVKLLDPRTNEPTRVGVDREGGVRRRVAKRSGEAID
jgi:large subunit ribosomal protein L24